MPAVLGSHACDHGAGRGIHDIADGVHRDERGNDETVGQRDGERADASLHRAIAAAEGGVLVRTWDGAVRPSRFAARCGTNFAAIAVPLTLVFQALWPPAVGVATPLVVPLAALAVSMELWQLVHRPRGRALRFLLLPGLALQRVTTREPALDDTRVALRATAAVLERELALREA